MLKGRFLYRLLASVVLICAASPLFADMVSKRIFQQDSAFKYDDSVLDLSVQTKKGSPYSEQVVDEDVKRLAAKGVFADVSASVKKVAPGSVEVTFRMIAKPLVEAVRFEGNQKIPDDKLRPELRFTLHTPLNDDLVMQTADRIRAMYKKAGREGSTVNPVFETRQDGNLTIVFKIQEELRIRINNVDFAGNTVYKTSELRDSIETRYNPMSAKWLTWLPLEGRMGLLDPNGIERDKMRLRELYLRKGYLDFKVKKVEQKPVEKNPEMVDVLFTVEEGEPYFVGDIVLTGVTAFPVKEIRSLIKQTPDNVYNVQIQDQDINRIDAKYSPEGYADLDVHVIRNPNFTNHTVDLEYHVTEGVQYTIGEITINGNKWTKPKVILRELPFKPDDKLDKRKLEIAKKRLMGMNYFEPAAKGTVAPASGVEVTAVRSAEPGKKDIQINVNEKRFINGRIGAGWSDTDGLAGMLELTHTNMDILDPANYFTGGGQKLRLYGLIGTERRNLLAEFTDPWLFGIPLRWDISGYWRQSVYENWDEYRLGLTTSLTKRFFDEFTTVQLGYTFEQVTIDNMDPKMGPEFQRSVGSDLVSKMFMKLERDTRDNYIDPRAGYDVSAFAFLTAKGLGASHNYYQVELKGVNYYSFFHDWFTLMIGAKIGMMDAFGGDNYVPLYDRYFLGGGNSLRGFPYRSVGPADSDKNNYGGEFMYLITAELTHPIYKDFLRGAFFLDFGNATESIFEFGKPNLGIGYGVRIKLPSFPMPIRLDLAYPIVNNQPGVSSQLRFHFNLGFSI